jgi:hypothetical protein
MFERDGNMLNQAVRPRLTKRIGRLDELAHNLWRSWHHQARDLFRILDCHLIYSDDFIEFLEKYGIPISHKEKQQ